MIRSLLQIGILCEVQIEKEKPYYYISPPSERHSAEPVWKRFNYDGKQPNAGESKGRGSIRTLVLFQHTVRVTIAGFLDTPNPGPV